MEVIYFLLGVIIITSIFIAYCIHFINRKAIYRPWRWQPVNVVERIYNPIDFSYEFEFDEQESRLMGFDQEKVLDYEKKRGVHEMVGLALKEDCIEIDSIDDYTNPPWLKKYRMRMRIYKHEN